MNLRDATQAANRETMVIPLMETVAAGDMIDAILDVKGVDAIFFGPADYSASAGFLGEWEGPGVTERLLAIHDKIRAAQRAVRYHGQGREQRPAAASRGSA